MSKIIVIILFTCVIICTGLPREQEPSSEDIYESDEDKYDLESKQDLDRTLEKEKELRLLRKAKKLKETNYRRALESILPAKNGQGYRKLFEDLINSSKEQFKSSESSKQVEEVVVTDTYSDDNESEGRNGEPQVEEIELVIEHITDDDKTKDGNNNDNEPTPVSRNSGSYESNNHHIMDFQQKPSRDSVTESNVNLDEDVTGITTHDSAADMDDMRIGNIAQRKVIGSYPVSRASEMVIPHYRTALTRSGMVVSPAVYTVKTTAPIVDPVTTRSWVANRQILSDIYGRSNPVRPDLDKPLIDDYKDYGGNAYRYSPSTSLFAQRQGDQKMEILPTQLGIMKPFRDNLRAGTFYSQPQRFYPNSYRPIFNFHH